MVRLGMAIMAQLDAGIAKPFLEKAANGRSTSALTSAVPPWRRRA